MLTLSFAWKLGLTETVCFNKTLFSWNIAAFVVWKLFRMLLGLDSLVCSDVIGRASFKKEVDLSGLDHVVRMGFGTKW